MAESKSAWTSVSSSHSLPHAVANADEALRLDAEVAQNALFDPCSIPSVRRLLELGRGR
jgi:hypothetical protein